MLWTIPRCKDIDRVLALPRRTPEYPEASFDQQFLRPGAVGALRPIQRLALLEANRAGGLLAFVGTGHGKTLTCRLLPLVLRAQRPLLLLPASMLAANEALNQEYDQTWLGSKFHILTYEQLSAKSGPALLADFSPDLIIADEAHALRHYTSARVKRLDRFLGNGTKFCALSGTLTARSPGDWAHLAFWALGPKSPAPLSSATTQAWGSYLGYTPGQPKPDPGALTQFGGGPYEYDDIVSGYRQWVVDTPGVVSTDVPSRDIPIHIFKHHPPELVSCKELSDQTWGEFQASKEGDNGDFSLYGQARQLALGFRYVQQWPGGKVDHIWVEARRDWYRCAAVYIGETNHPGMDTPALLAANCNDPRVPDYVRAAFREWAKVVHLPGPARVAEWQNDELWRYLELAQAHAEPTLIWYEHIAVAERAAALGYNVCWPGQAPEEHEGYDVFVSIAAHGQGKNLQAWSHNLVLTPPSNGAKWEQLLSRTVRPGQAAPAVQVAVLQHCAAYARALEAARQHAAYLKSATGQEQKLLGALVS